MGISPGSHARKQQQQDMFCSRKVENMHSVRQMFPDKIRHCRCGIPASLNDRRALMLSGCRNNAGSKDSEETEVHIKSELRRH